MAEIIAAAASMIGYVGAEVAEECLFERVLWPQRFGHNSLSLTALAKLVILIPMGGPLHRAALSVVDTFRRNGLYRGRLAGSALGTAFFPDGGLHYVHHTARSLGEDEGMKKVRNGFWVEVLRSVNPDFFVTDRLRKADGARTSGGDSGGPASNEEKAMEGRLKRSIQHIYRLRLEVSDTHESHEVVSEDCVKAGSVIGIIVSELISMAMALAAGIYTRYSPLVVLQGLPVALKLLALLVSVRRERLQIPKQTCLKLDCSERARHGTNAATADASRRPPASPSLSVHLDIFQVFAPALGIVFIETDNVCLVRQFFRHYGHPIRVTRLDRAREVLCIGIVYLFAIKFPAELLALAWAPAPAQWMWLGYQLYAVVAMHVARLTGLTGCGRTEERVARLLEQHKVAYLGSTLNRLAASDSRAIRASLRVEDFNGVAEAEQRRNDIVESARSASLSSG